MKKIIKFIFELAIIIVLLYSGFIFLESKNFNGFGLAHYQTGITKVSRDRTEKFQKEWSYKIDSQDYNDFMIYKTIPVEKNTAYKVTCMVKTNQIEAQGDNISGFNICLKDSLEKSPSLMGTNDWTELAFYFNSYNNDTIDIGFRLGDNEGNCKGTAWFSNIQIEEGKQKQTNEWKFAVFMLNTTNAKVGKQRISEQLTSVQVAAIRNSLDKFKNTLEDFSGNEIRLTYDIIPINKELTSISYDKETGYFVAPKDVYSLINNYLYQKECYDHIFVVANIGNTIDNKKIDWVGLGSMIYDNIGYSNIRISDKVLGTYQSSNINFFTEEVMLHEFLHTLERNSMLLNNQTIALHDYEKYGYKSEGRYGLRKWYLDYMQKNVNGNLGLEKEAFHTQPVSEKNFKSRKNITEILYNRQNFVQKMSEAISKIL